MRVLLDESLPRKLVRELIGHEVHTVREQGWQGLKNGELLKRARAADFDVLVTADQNLEYQQNVQHAGIGIIVAVAITNSIEDLLPLVPSILEALAEIQPNRVVRVSAR